MNPTWAWAFFSRSHSVSKSLCQSLLSRPGLRTRTRLTTSSAAAEFNQACGIEPGFQVSLAATLTGTRRTCDSRVVVIFIMEQSESGRCVLTKQPEILLWVRLWLVIHIKWSGKVWPTQVAAVKLSKHWPASRFHLWCHSGGFSQRGWSLLYWHSNAINRNKMQWSVAFISRNFPHSR